MLNDYIGKKMLKNRKKLDEDRKLKKNVQTVGIVPSASPKATC